MNKVSIVPVVHRNRSSMYFCCIQNFYFIATILFLHIYAITKLILPGSCIRSKYILDRIVGLVHIIQIDIITFLFHWYWWFSAKWTNYTIHSSSLPITLLFWILISKITNSKYQNFHWTHLNPSDVCETPQKFCQNS